MSRRRLTGTLPATAAVPWEALRRHGLLFREDRVNVPASPPAPLQTNAANALS
jgi:hypothetical protein